MEKIIDKWIEENTVPYNTPFRKRTVEIFTSNRNGQNLDDMFGCRFIVYKGERRIILNNKDHCKYDFYLLECDSHYDSKMPSLDPLVYTLLGVEYVGEYILEKEIYVKRDRIHDIEIFFNIKFDMSWRNYDDSDDISICWTGNGWNQYAETSFEHSEIFKLLKETLKEYFQYEYAPYKKYNPEFDPFNYEKQNENFDKIFEVLTKEQIVKVLTVPCYDENSLLDKESNQQELIKFLNMIDVETIKQFILSRKNLTKEMFVNTCNTFYNL